MVFVLLLLFVRNFLVPSILIFSLWIWEDKFKKNFIVFPVIALVVIDLFVIRLSVSVVISLLFLIVFALYNRHLSPWGYPLIFTGGFSNNLVVFMNNGKMPVLEYNTKMGMYATSYIQMSEKTWLNILADRIPVPLGYGAYASVGDAVALVGVFILIGELLRYRKKSNNKEWHNTTLFKFHYLVHGIHPEFIIYLIYKKSRRCGILP